MNSRLAAISPSLIRELNRRKQPGDIDLGLGEPLLPPDTSLLAAALGWLEQNGCRYGPNAGLLEVRETMVRYLGYPGLEHPDQICLTNGAQEAVFLAIKAICDDQTDEMLIIEPTYPLYHKIAQLEAINVRNVSLPAADNFAFAADTILTALQPQTRLIVLCSPCNPTARIASEPMLDQLATGLLALANPPWVLVDESYHEIFYTAQEPPRLAKHYPRTLVAGSLSKSNALTGLRIGWLLAPLPVMPATLKIHQLLLTSASIFGQRIVCEILTRRLLTVHRPYYDEQRRSFTSLLERHGIPHLPPEGTFYVLAKLPTAWAHDSIKAAYHLLEKFGVVAIPGRAFGAAAEGYLRLSFVAPPQLLEEGVARLSRFFAAS
ncbi:MAG: pyridoxal phosphate-dependent aminotransferase [Cyanobacteria bacterium NC_groundwater_1444_Ag_S-0.65um_54_12]|nr:pyridoxal phosphate-dependent aminotransferase [Cyanobacteria bacterium NC_groundwater_1444_Ag_S-0.65um_54_12]